MARQLFALFALLSLFACTFATFTYVQTLDGMGPTGTAYSNNFTEPTGLDYYNGYLYVADESNKFIYVLSNNTVVTRSGGSGLLDGPRGIRYDEASGKTYVADFRGSNVRIALSSSQFENLGKLNEFPSPTSLVFSGDSIFVLDMHSSKISELSKSRGVTLNYWTFAGGGNDALSNPSDLALYNGRFYVADTDNNRVAVFDSNFTFLQSIGIGKGGVQLWHPKGLYVDNSLLYVSDSSNNRIAVFSLDGYPLETFSASDGGALNNPTDLAIANGMLYVADTGNSVVKVYGITRPEGNQTVLAQISDANASVAKLQSLISVAATLGIGVQNTAAPLLESASASYSNFQYSDASDQARSAKQAADTQYPTLSQQVTISLRKLEANATGALAQYTESSTPESLAPNRTALASKVSQVETSISIGDFQNAADVALQLPSLSSSFVSAAGGAVAAEQNNAASAQQQEYYSRIAAKRASLTELSAKAAANRQPLDSSQISSLLDLARSQAQSSSFADADAALEQVSTQLASLSAGLEQKISAASVAFDAINRSQAQVQKIEGEKLIFYPNTQPARTLLSQASDAAPTDPDKASSLAIEAVDSATREASNARTLSYIAIAVGGLAIIVLLVAGIVVWYLHKRRHKGL
ncbi:NHL repeat protein [Candidatus Anstonella stagnisolia]|nr:NHL repeat protein [Candidatus Anstonella stagnisolia]